MNEFLEQFLVECRELVEQATDDLLALEENPREAERLDGAFRGFHTLKGAAGIVDFAAMARALHAAEDVLSAARAGEAAVTPALIGDCLTALDQVAQWLEAIQATGELPVGAEVEAEAVVRRFARPAAGVSAALEPAADWLEALLSRHGEAAGRARTALRYAPDRDSFFRGIDPLALMESLPGLLALEFAPAGPWPPLAELDPFACRLVFMALLEGEPDAARTALASVASETELRALGAEDARSSTAEALLAAQVAMLGEASPEGLPGRIASAGRVAASVLRRERRFGDAEALEQALGRALEANDPRPLREAIEGALQGELPSVEAEVQGARGAPEAATRALRVDVERVDALVNLTGELTVAKNALAHAAALAQAGGDPTALAETLKAQHAQLDRLVSELQRAVLNIRVLPLRHVFQRFPRLVREMVVGLGKPARLVTEGDATEADKAVVEALFEPLLHVLRNALDHGVEPAQERAAAGKPPSATIVLRAHRDGDQVVVEVEDDGRGIDVARVREVAARRGVADPETLAAMSDEDAIDLVFAPGFSTAAQVTSVSGRGVGMDAVRNAIERLGGRVRIASRAGEGTTVRFLLPFTVMMSRVMTVEAGGQVFGIPLEAVIETVRIPRDRIVPVGAAQAFVLRERTAPLIDLGEVLGGPAAVAGGEANVVVASAGGQMVGLRVDRLGERMDVMLKPIGGLLAGAPGVAGATLLGDGRVLLVLDVAELLQ
ncbi:chemotaxis protein CheA [Phenylobacterium sp.]|uniref:chemotaxis protein CheA n=1 Tax=Phenylobacterium sp. TaxID=1871053 RepID=UPI002B5E015F|nr:chemotaxis protein CheA [Phenylobacterium sp.]HVI33863.1 chemotaxis protein CheA [Phenylobacterium sp.]